MELFFIRHAESMNNFLYSQTGSDRGRSVDPEVTERGQIQIKYLASLIATVTLDQNRDGELYDPFNFQGFQITHIYCSPMIRALETAAGISQATNKPVHILVDLHEVGGIVEKDEVTEIYNGLAGYSRSYLVSRYPDFQFPSEISEDGWWKRPFEPEEDRFPRASRVLDYILERHEKTQDRVVLLSHGAFYNYFMKAIIGWFYDPLYLSLANTAITRIDFKEYENKNYRALRYMNRVDFLPRDLVTI